MWNLRAAECLYRNGDMADTSEKDKVKQPKGPVQTLDGNSYNPQQDILELLKSKCPEVFTEGKIDVEKLKLTLGEELDTHNERYGLTWAGKSECFRHIQEATSATLKPRRDESVDFDTTENMFIEGDNLEVLKILQKTYQNKIKMIYIDPPYNTGNDSFIYPDRFKEEKEDYEQRAGIKDAEGLLTKDGFWRKNSKDAGHFHSNWLSMMYPRLFLAKNLLREDDVIFVSIDDNEVQNLRMIMNEIFGENNFIASVIWQKVFSPKNTAKYFSEDHDYVFLYAKDIEQWQPHLLPRSDKAEARYSNPDDDPRGPWTSSDLTARNYYSQGRYEVVGPTGKKFGPGVGRYWRQNYESFLKLEKEKRVWWGEGGNNMPRLKRFLSQVKQGVVPQTIWFHKDAGNTQEAKKELIELVGFHETENVLNTLKPTRLIQRMLQISTAPTDNDIVLDFFSGSASTAQAVLKQNATDNGDRHFICVQIAEPLPVPEMNLATIGDIGKQRIRSTAKKIEKEIEGNLKFEKNKLDLGFKVFRLDRSNFKQWRQKVKTGGELREQMRMFVDNVKKGADPEDMLFEIILKNSRFDLNVKIEKPSFDGIDYYRLAEGVEMVCLAGRITKKFVEKVLKEKPERFTCLDVAFKNNDQLKTNTALQMEAEKIDFKVI